MDELMYVCWRCGRFYNEPEDDDNYLAGKECPWCGATHGDGTRNIYAEDLGDLLEGVQFSALKKWIKETQ